MKRLIFGIALSFVLSSAASAADAGWGLQFHYDAFEDKTYPMAIMGETTEGMAFDPANLFMACKDGSVAVIFQPERYSFSTGDTITGRFRGVDGVQEFSFSPVDMPAFGRQRAIEGAQAKSFTDLFLAAPGPVPFQYGDKQGNFPSFAFVEVHDIMTEHCAEV